MFPVVMFPLSRISQSRAFKLLTLLRGGDSLKSLQRLSQSPHNPCRSSFEGLSRLRFLETLKLRLFPVTETNILSLEIKVYDIAELQFLFSFLSLTKTLLFRGEFHLLVENVELGRFGNIFHDILKHTYINIDIQI